MLSRRLFRVRNQTVGSRGSLNNLDVSPYIRIRSVIRVGGERVTYVCTTGSVFSVCVSACLCGRLQDVVHVCVSVHVCERACVCVSVHASASQCVSRGVCVCTMQLFLRVCGI